MKPGNDTLAAITVALIALAIAVIFTLHHAPMWAASFAWFTGGWYTWEAVKHFWKGR